MCGISGYISKSKPIDISDFYEAHKLIRHRGPDDEGFIVQNGQDYIQCKGCQTHTSLNYLEDIGAFISTNVIFSHVRLSIIDLTEAGHQPFIYKNLILTYNGEIYNYLELKTELINMGYTFSSHSDTEVILKAYDAWGEKSFERFNGMWAIAIYNKENKRLILSRDRFGVKPLFYTFIDGGIVFSSEIKFLTALNLSHEVNESAIKAYLYEMKLSYSDETLFKGIYELEPSHYMIMHNGNITVRKYWDLKISVKIKDIDEAVDMFSTIFEDSVKIRMRSDLSVGSLLSGGLDSNTILGSLKKLNMLNEKYQVFSSVYEEKKYSEEKYIKDTEKFFHIHTNYIYMKSDAIFETLDSVIYQMDCPIRSCSSIMQYILYKNIKNNSDIRVVLNGQGADEAFAGYNFDYIVLIYCYLLELKFGKSCRELRMYIKYRKEKVLNIFWNILKLIKRYGVGKNRFNNISLAQVTSTPLREYMMYDDRMSMSFGIEARAPFMDYRIMEFAFTLDKNCKIDNFTNKRVVRSYAKDLIPDSIMLRKDKMGFTSPEMYWRNHEWKNEIHATFKKIEKNGLFNLDVTEILKQYNKTHTIDFIHWRLFCLYRWKNICVK